MIFQMFDTLHETACSLKLWQCTCHSDVFSTAAWRKSHGDQDVGWWVVDMAIVSFSDLPYIDYFYLKGLVDRQILSITTPWEEAYIILAQQYSSHVIQKYNFSTTMNAHLPREEEEPSMHRQDFIMLCWRRSSQVVTWLNALDQRQSGEETEFLEFPCGSFEMLHP